MKTFMFIGIEDRVMSSVASLGVPVWVALSVTAHGIPGSVASITGAVSSVLPSVTYVLPMRFSVGSTISVLKSLWLKR